MNPRTLLKRLTVLVALLLAGVMAARAAVASRGIITALTPAGTGNARASVFIAGPREEDTQNEEASFFVTESTRIFRLENGQRVAATFADLKVGQRAEASYMPGPMILIYPPQGTASEIVILGPAATPPAAPVLATAPTTPAAVPKAMADVDWTLAAWTAADGAIIAADRVTLRFAPEGRASGRGPVNNYFGNVKITTDGAMTWAGGFGSTRMAGPPERMQLETRWLADLAATNKADLVGGKLILTGKDKLRLEFTTSAAAKP